MSGALPPLPLDQGMPVNTRAKEGCQETGSMGVSALCAESTKKGSCKEKGTEETRRARFNTDDVERPVGMGQKPKVQDGSHRPEYRILPNPPKEAKLEAHSQQVPPQLHPATENSCGGTCWNGQKPKIQDGSHRPEYRISLNLPKEAKLEAQSRQVLPQLPSAAENSCGGACWNGQTPKVQGWQS